MEDFNIDLLKFESCSYSKELLELTQSFSLLPAVDKPTRVYGNSAALIDNIFSNNLENSLICGNIVSVVSVTMLPHMRYMHIWDKRCNVHMLREYNPGLLLEPQQMFDSGKIRALILDVHATCPEPDTSPYFRFSKEYGFVSTNIGTMRPCQGKFRQATWPKK